jgi:hypothetical protein
MWLYRPCCAPAAFPRPFNLAMNGEIQLYESEPILAEYEDVLRRPRLAINVDKVTVALARIHSRFAGPACRTGHSRV